MQVRDAVCLVTGSAQGLGKAFAVRLLAAGAKVCISDVREEGGLATLEELKEKFGAEKVTFVQCDVTKPEQFSKLFDECEAYFKVPF
jgi:NAD(P)-dependent dehydrogenase (short-subunit alcohol dehydrogenase family)